MSSCNFSVEFQQTPDQVVKKAENAIVKAGGKFTGDSSSGSFSLSTGIGSVKGGYSITGNLMSIEISEKPVFIGCSRIESEIRKYLAGEFV